MGKRRVLTIVSGPMDDDWDGAWVGEVLTAERIRMNGGWGC